MGQHHAASMKQVHLVLVQLLVTCVEGPCSSALIGRPSVQLCMLLRGLVVRPAAHVISFEKVRDWHGLEVAAEPESGDRQVERLRAGCCQCLTAA